MFLDKEIYFKVSPNPPGLNLDHFRATWSWHRLELIAENVLPVCMILGDLLTKASVSDLDSCQKKAK